MDGAPLLLAVEVDGAPSLLAVAVEVSVYAGGVPFFSGFFDQDKSGRGPKLEDYLGLRWMCRHRMLWIDNNVPTMDRH